MASVREFMLIFGNDIKATAVAEPVECECKEISKITYAVGERVIYEKNGVVMENCLFVCLACGRNGAAVRILG